MSWSMLTGGALALVAAVIPAASTAQQPATAARSLVFDGVTVVDVEHGKLLPAQRVVIVGNRIQAVGGRNATSVPTGAQVVDARGKYLIPGLWDMHTHSFELAHIFYPFFVANGVTGIRDAWSDVPLDTVVRWWHEIVAGTRIGPPRQLLNGWKAVNGLAPSGSPVSVFVDSLRLRKAQGANFVKFYALGQDGFPGAAAARQVGLPFGGHVEGISAIQASDSGISVIDHVISSGGLDTLCLVPGLLPAQDEFFPARRQDGSVERCQPVADVFRRNGTWFAPTMSILLPKSLWAPRAKEVSVRLAEFARTFWSGGALTMAAAHADTGATGTRPPRPTTDSSAGPSSDSVGILSVIQRVGLPILAGTDVTGRWWPDAGILRWDIGSRPPGFALHAELEMFVVEGLTPLNALQSATLNPAKMLRATDSLGTVAPGKLADLVLLDADPLAAITNTRTIRAVVANGRYFDRAALDQLLIGARTVAKAAGVTPPPP